MGGLGLLRKDRVRADWIVFGLSVFVAVWASYILLVVEPAAGPDAPRPAANAADQKQP